VDRGRALGELVIVGGDVVAAFCVGDSGRRATSWSRTPRHQRASSASVRLRQPGLPMARADAGAVRLLIDAGRPELVIRSCSRLLLGSCCSWAARRASALPAGRSPFAKASRIALVGMWRRIHGRILAMLETHIAGSLPKPGGSPRRWSCGRPGSRPGQALATPSATPHPRVQGRKDGGIGHRQRRRSSRGST